jgi:hypothetical protein
MADTGERRQIIGRANAKELETIRASQKIISEERSTAEARNAAFDDTGKSSRRRTDSQRPTKRSRQRSRGPKASKM